MSKPITDEQVAEKIVTGEQWKDVSGYEGYYQVSSLGRIRSLDRRVRLRDLTRMCSGKVLKQTAVQLGGIQYYQVSLSVKNIIKHRLVHRLIAQTFIPNPKNKEQVNHIDFNGLNNRLENLEWTTPKENSRHSMHRYIPPAGERNGQSKLTIESVLEIRKTDLAGTLNKQELAKDYGVCVRTIDNIITRATWRHI